MGFLKSVPRSVKTPFGIAILFIIVGSGNIIFGGIKAREHRALYLQALATDRERPAAPATDDTHLPPAIGDSPYTELIRARFDFYIFVVAGGKWILGLAGLFLLLAMVGLRDGGHGASPSE